MRPLTDYLAISWAISRGRETHGYNICRLDVRSTGKRYRCMGGGYDMVGTVVAEWLQRTYQDRLRSLEPQPGTTLYGMRKHADGHVSLDGVCGISSMESIAAALGIILSRTYNRKGHTTGYMVTDYGSAEEMAASAR